MKETREFVERVTESKLLTVAIHKLPLYPWGGEIVISGLGAILSEATIFVAPWIIVYSGTLVVLPLTLRLQS